MTERRFSIRGYPITRRFVLFVGLFISLMVTFTFQLLYADQIGLQGALIDDAYISLRYSQSLIQGHGIVWQPGDRVEGYTNFLWVILSAFLMVIGFDGTNTVRFLGLFSSVISIALLILLSRHFQKLQNIRVWPIGIAAILVGTSFDFAFWTLSGLESPLFIMLSLTGLYFTLKVVETPERLRYAIGSGLALAAATLTRPDGAVLVIALWIPWLIYRVLASRKLASVFEHPFLTAFALYTCIVLAHLLWRYSYYGQLLPNTFYVKVGATVSQVQRGINYIIDTTRFVGLMPLIPLALFALLPPAKDQNSEQLKLWTSRLMVLSMAICYTAYLISIGGDIFTTRLLMMVFVLVCFLIDIGINNLINVGVLLKIPISRVIPLSVLALALIINPNRLHSHLAGAYIGQINWNRTGEWLRAHAEPTDTLAIDAAGSVPYFSGLRSIDMLGLNDAYIAHMSVRGMGRGVPGHEKFDPAYVYAKSPTWIATWLDREGRAASLGMYRWPEVHDYRLTMVVQAQDPSRPWMQLADSHYAPQSGYDQGYRYGIWKRIPEAVSLAYTDLNLEDQTVVQQVGPWEWMLKPVSGNDYLSSITPGAALKFEIDGGQAIAAVTLRHNTSGQIQIQADGQAIVCDLYSSVTVPQAPCILPPVGKPGEHVQVTIVIDAARNPASGGGGVHIQRLLTLPPASYARLEQ